MYSLVIPVYGNEGSLPELLLALKDLDRELAGRLEVVLVVDGSPDRSEELLREALPGSGLRARLVVHSRNFGSFAAIRSGLAEGTGPFYAVMAADLQEPPELVLRFFRMLEADDADVVLGTREGRADPLPSRLASSLYWSLYRRFVQPEMPPGGVDVFGCNRLFRDRLLTLEESNSSLVGLLLWLGFRRATVPYRRLPRRHGRSGWSLSRKLRYLMDSAFAFSDLPVRALTFVGAAGLAFSAAFAAIVVLAKLSGLIPVPGYAATVLLIAFFAGLNCFGLGVIGSYVWRAFENTKGRPMAVVMDRERYGGDADG